MAAARVKIAHLSDLHFGLSRSPLLQKVFDKEIVKIFHDHIVAQKPDLIIASGDLANNPLRWQLRRAHDFLGSLRAECQLSPDRLIVLPGNHDVSYLGNFGYKPFTSRAFNKTFPDWNRMPYFFDPSLGLFVYWFDSNPSGLSNFARGQVRQSELGTFSAQIAERLRSDQREQFIRSFKVAVVHHHPMAVPYSGSDTFLLLNGAGDFLSEMAKYGVDLVLHGHKHHWGFARAQVYPRGDDIRVLAGGTLGRVRERPRYNLLTLYENGTVEATVFHVPPGGTVEEEKSDVEKGRRKGVTVFDLEAAKARDFLRSAQALGTRYESVLQYYCVRASGDVQVRTTCKGMRVEPGSAEVRAHSFKVASETGYVRGVEAFRLRAGGLVPLQLDPQETRASLRSGTWSFRFDEPLDSGSDSASFEYEYWILNGLARNQEDAEVMYGPGSTIYEGVQVNRINKKATEKLIFRIEFEDFRPDVKAAQFNVINPEGKPEPSLSKEFREGLELDDATPSRIEARIEKPRFGYFYEVKWPLPTASGSVHEDIAAIARLLRHKLLELRGESRDPQIEALRKLVMEKLATIQSELRQKALAHDGAELMDVSLMVWDEDARVLRTVQGLLPTDHAAWDWTVAFGDGLAGRALKLRKRFVYVQDQVTEERYRYYISSDEAQTERSAFVHKILLSEPVFLGETFSEVLGVLNIGSNSNSSGLYRLASDKSETAPMEEWSQKNAAELALSIFKPFAPDVAGKT